MAVRQLTPTLLALACGFLAPALTAGDVLQVGWKVAGLPNWTSPVPG